MQTADAMVTSLQTARAADPQSATSKSRRQQYDDAISEVHHLKILLKTPDSYPITLTKFKEEVHANGAANIRAFDEGEGGVEQMTIRVRLRGIEKDKAKQKVFEKLRGLSGSRQNDASIAAKNREIADEEKRLKDERALCHLRTAY